MGEEIKHVFVLNITVWKDQRNKNTYDPKITNFAIFEASGEKESFCWFDYILCWIKKVEEESKTKVKLVYT